MIKFTSDDRYFVTGGEDGSVLSWSLQVCADPDRDPGSISPYRVYSGHTLGISDICLSSGLYQHAIFFTASLDGKCKVGYI